nr:hypothetical protein K-LCC10_0250 [Kaumoebavirus]
MDPDTFQLFCGFLPVELAHIINDYLIVAYRRENARKCAKIAEAIQHLLCGDNQSYIHVDNHHIYCYEMMYRPYLICHHSGVSITYEISKRHTMVPPEAVISHGRLAREEFHWAKK